MRVLLSGGTGLIGSAIVAEMLRFDSTLEIWIFSRTAHASTTAIRYICSIEEIPTHTKFGLIINLNGAGIADKRWTKKRKQTLRQSRILHTKNLVGALRERHIRTELWLNASAVGYYGDHGQDPVTENTVANYDFAHALCKEWEHASSEAKPLSERHCILRLGLVLSPQGGFLAKITPPFKLGLGAILGDGNQFMPWVHIDDVVSAVLFLHKNKELTGAFNITAPQPVSNDTFSRILAKSLRRPLILRTPSWLLKLLLGEMSVLLTGGQRAIPERLVSSGFTFKHPKLEDAL
jgi:uncharacterized protein (TIGR01777 family)